MKTNIQLQPHDDSTRSVPNATIEPAQCMDVCWHCHCHCRLYAPPPPFPVHAYVLVPVIGTGTGSTTHHITSYYVTLRHKQKQPHISRVSASVLDLTP